MSSLLKVGYFSLGCIDKQLIMLHRNSANYVLFENVINISGAVYSSNLQGKALYDFYASAQLLVILTSPSSNTDVYSPQTNVK